MTVKDDEEATDVMPQTITIKEKSFPEQLVYGMPLWILLLIIIGVGTIAAVVGITFAKKRKPT